MTKQKFVVLIEKDEDGIYIGTVPELKGCYSYGDTLDELMENIREAILAHLELLKSRNEPLPPIKFQGIQEIERSRLKIEVIFSEAATHLGRRTV